jgi:competence protein CoiA
MFLQKEASILLTAKTKTGKKISLGYNYKKETLLSLRKTEEFICPVCGENVTLKLGDHRIFHFSHKKGTECRNFYESESVYHMEGKRQLYQWLLQQKIPSELEYYDKEIQQRPDIMFHYNGRKYALEYQCSSIPERAFSKRTETYIENGYTPIWVLGNKHVHQKKKNIVSLSNFHYMFIRGSTRGTCFLPAYCPEKRIFHLLESIYSYSAKNSFVKHHFLNPNNLILEGLLNPIEVSQINFHQWYHELDYSFINWSLHQSSLQQSLLQEIYQHNLNPYLLPPEIGLPVPQMIFIQTSPLIWQTYFYLDVLAGKIPGHIFNVFTINRAVKKRIDRREVIPRKLAQFPEGNYLISILSYVKELIKLGYITEIGEDVYQINRCLEIPTTNREKELRRKNFYEKYCHFH